ncbi:MAG: flavin reductase family protein [Atopobiaceae bacterium]|jgi:flavin reductase (DIM6/NTAB) family NADH-FMN oxidoreductase RutF
MKKNLDPKCVAFPQPVFIIGSYDKDGVPNAMNAAWCGQTTFTTLEINLSSHKSTENILEQKAFTVFPADVSHLEVSDYFGMATGRKLNKAERSGLTFVKSEHVNAPLIVEYPVAIECEVVEVQKLEHDWRIVGKIVNVQADEAVLDEKGAIDFSKMRALVYDPAHRSYRIVGEELGKAWDAGKAFFSPKD